MTFFSILDRFRRTQSAHRPIRSGTSGELVYAVGDIHGRYDLLKVLLSTLESDCRRFSAGRIPVIIFCGDYVDRGPDSAAVIEALIWLQQRSDLDVRLLKGNHEQAFVKFLDQPGEGRGWLEIGGLATLASYGVDPPQPEDEGGEVLIRARDDLMAKLPASHLKLLENLELMIVVGDYAFVHAGIKPGKPLSGQQERDLLWIGEEFTAAGGPFEKVIVHGHSWRGDKAEVLAHRVGLDTGAYATGVLTAVRLDGGEVTVLSARKPGAAPWNPWALPTATAHQQQA